MRVSLLVLILFPGAFVGSSVNGKFRFPETKQVPISRLFTNLQERLARNTNDFNLTYQLARVHSMAYATNLVQVSVTEKEGMLAYHSGRDAGVPRQVRVFATAEARRLALQHLTNAFTLYRRALVLLRKSTNVNEQLWMVRPTHLGLAWCLDQSGQRDKALAAYRATLTISWRMEVMGEFDMKEWASGAWYDMRAGVNPIPSRRRDSLGPDVCYSEEVIGYMLRLLDANKDEKEIAELQERRKVLHSMGRAVTPILVPLEPGAATFAHLVDVNASVRFDLDGSGLPRKWGWITPKAAWLVYDSDGKGQITSALQMFGNVTFWIFWPDGYAALEVLDDNGDGVLRGPELRGLALWQDLNSDGVSDPGEVRSVDAFGITAISCAGRAFAGDMKWNPRGITFDDGTTRPSYDWIAPSK